MSVASATNMKYDYIIDLGLKFHKGGRLSGLAISSGWPGTGWLADSCLEFEQFFFLINGLTNIEKGLVAESN